MKFRRSLQMLAPVMTQSSRSSIWRWKTGTISASHLGIWLDFQHILLILIIDQGMSEGLRGKMGKGRRAPIPACIGNKTHGWNIYLLLMIHTELTLNENFWPPLPPQKCSKLFRQSLREIVQKCCDFSATFSVEKKHSPSPHFGQIPKESVFFTHVLIPSSSVAKIRELYPEEDGKYMGYERKKND